MDCVRRPTGVSLGKGGSRGSVRARWLSSAENPVIALRPWGHGELLVRYHQGPPSIAASGLIIVIRVRRRIARSPSASSGSSNAAAQRLEKYRTPIGTRL